MTTGDHPHSELLQRLFALRDTGTIAQWADAAAEDWKPDLNECHRNADIVAGRSPDGWTAIRGWFVNDLSLAELIGFRSHIAFIAHSVVADQEGKLFDITPSRASKQYPFIRHPGTNAEFEDLIDHKNVKQLNYFFD